MMTTKGFKEWLLSQSRSKRKNPNWGELAETYAAYRLSELKIKLVELERRAEEAERELEKADKARQSILLLTGANPNCSFDELLGAVSVVHASWEYRKAENAALLAQLAVLRDVLQRIDEVGYDCSKYAVTKDEVRRALQPSAAEGYVAVKKEELK